MDDDSDDIRELVRQTGRTEELTGEELQSLRRRIQDDHLDKVLNGERR